MKKLVSTLLIGMTLAAPAHAADGDCPNAEPCVRTAIIPGGVYREEPREMTAVEQQDASRQAHERKKFEAWCRESSWWRMFNSDCPR